VKKYREPEEGEVRQAGWAYLTDSRGWIFNKVHSCENCADETDQVWIPALYEGTCTGCDVALSGQID